MTDSPETYCAPTIAEQRATPYGQARAQDQQRHADYVASRIAWDLCTALQFARKGGLFGFVAGEYIGAAGARLNEIAFVEGVYERAVELRNAVRSACMILIASMPADALDSPAPTPRE